MFLAFPIITLQQKEVHLLIIGDSLAAGLTPHISKIAKKENIKFHADGRGGTTLKQWVDFNWAEKDFKKYEHDIILVSLGINDYGRTDNRSKLKIRAKKIVELAKGTPVIWLVPAVKRKSSQFVYEAVKDSGALILDVRQLNIEHPPGDVHPTGNGYKYWSKEIWNFIQHNVSI